ncbi:hypothetical protein BDY24DRAFT_383994 [Mrakia frigida]|uniref:fatty acid alpha-hydroxylase n=1 Tax=Mrakia frigida TaxID=29902 RepID=UPI003FCC073D
MSLPTKAALRPSKSQHKIFAITDVGKHDKLDDMWMSHNGLVYDVTKFINDHPGGDDVLMPFAGKDITLAMSDEDSHVHSKSAYQMMSEFVVGRVVIADKIVDDDWEATEDFHPDDTDVMADFERCEFIDLSQPMLPQILWGNFSKEFYLEQVHQPRHVTYSARMFPYPFLEVFTLTQWYIVPIIWVPIWVTLFITSTLQFSPQTVNMTATTLLSTVLSGKAGSIPFPTSQALANTGMCWAIGCFLWTLLEYGFHRFLFHVDYYLPDNNVALLIHFTAHGVHHFLPMDGLRLVMPPVLFFILQLPFTNLAHAILPHSAANGVISGAFTFYVFYDCMHYAMHHTKLPAYLTKMKQYHLAHHYKNFELGFGVTSKIWDVVFGTALDMSNTKK